MPPADATTTSVRLRPPPAALMRLVNPVMRVAIRSRLGRRMEPLAVLRFVGRRSGKRRDIPVGVHEVDGVACVFTDRPWRLSFRNGADVTVFRAGRVRAGRASSSMTQIKLVPRWPEPLSTSEPASSGWPSPRIITRPLRSSPPSVAR